MFNDICKLNMNLMRFINNKILYVNASVVVYMNVCMYDCDI